VRLRAALVHLGLSVALACVLLLVVTRLWYPAPFFALAKARDIFLMLIGCDIVLGPMMTLVIFDIRKTRRELIRDVSMIAFVQLAAMVYGVSTLLQARPAYIVYNAGQFNVVLANELVDDPGAGEPAVSVGAPWTGPKPMGARMPADGQVRSRLLFSALKGAGDVFQMPRYFVSYAEVQAEAASRARSPEALARELNLEVSSVQVALRDLPHSSDSTGLLPLVVRDRIAVAVVGRPGGELLGIAPLPHPQ
jgi:hypothetical protein